MTNGTKKMTLPGDDYSVEDRKHKNGKKYKVVTTNGYPFDQVASALQKEIRRGHEEEAMFWALELEDRFYHYVWKRLAIIASEDVGLANPQASILIDSLWSSYDKIKKNQEKGLAVDPNILAFAVLYLSRCPKNREVDEFKNVVFFEREQGKRLEIPESAIDMHTREGRAAGKDINTFWTDGCQVEPAVGGSAYRTRCVELTGGNPEGEVDEPERSLMPPGFDIEKESLRGRTRYRKQPRKRGLPTKD